MCWTRFIQEICISGIEEVCFWLSILILCYDERKLWIRLKLKKQLYWQVGNYVYNSIVENLLNINNASVAF